MKRSLMIIAILAVLLPVFAGQYNIGSGTSTQYYVPVYGYYGYNWSKTIYTAADLDNA